MTVFFTSDTHFGHANVIKYCKRPFASAEDMDAALIQNWNSVVTATDVVYHLGDFSFHKRPAERLIFDQLRGYKILIRGNHDHSDTTTLAWSEQYDYFEFPDAGLPVVLCHYPFAVWNRSYHNSLHLHGHSHGTTLRSCNRIDVGVDCNEFTPRTLEQLIEANRNHPPLLRGDGH